MNGSGHRRARRWEVIAGAALLLFALGWTATIWLTVPAGYGVGPRAFPLWLGVALAVLSALLLARGLLGSDEDESEEEDGGPAATTPRRLGMVLAVCGIISAYGLLMPRLGFVLATMVTVAATLALVLGERRPLVVGGMALGLALGAWFAFGRILGAYMPHGSWLPDF
ncbi:MAG: tripartite tricarboxylate transporter TctB family protein [Alphaproteobacteria bacterium]|nr:MAG: tripartite tricarboxylate transporter TctB family protein [Alphaproteobacteria bacterium]